MGSHWVVMGEQPKIKWKSLVVATLFLLVLLPGSLVANGDAEIFRYVVLIAGCGFIFFFVLSISSNWEYMRWKPEEDDLDDDE